MSDKKGEVKWTRAPIEVESQTVVDPKYSKVGERIRHITPSAFQCSMFCGGKQCKYENPGKWKNDEMAINGTYSSWYVINSIQPNARLVYSRNIV